MEDKKITPQESMALIAQMIESSKQRVAMPDLHISIMWAVLTILTGKYHNGKEVRSGERREDTD